MKQYLPQLAQCPLFARIDPPEILRMLSCLGAQVATYQKDNVVLRQDDPARFFGVVLKGSIHILRGDMRGDHTIIAAFGPCQLFGETFACASLDALPVNVIAGEDSAILLLEHTRIITACSNGCIPHSRLVTNLMRIIAERNLMLNQKLDFVMQRTTRDKLMVFLQAQAAQAHSDRFTIPFDRQQLADYLGVERSAMSTELNKLKKAGRIDFHKNEFRLLPS